MSADRNQLGVVQRRGSRTDGKEGFADVRVLEGALEELKSGGPVKLPSFTRTKRINT